MESNRPTSYREKRRDERATITLRVDYKRLNTFFADYTKNISKGGTFIRTNKPLDVGTQFVFVLTFPAANDGSSKIELKGEVMWTVTEEAASPAQPPGMGIRFLFDNEADRTKVDTFVEDLMTKALGEHISSKLLSKSR